MPGFLSAGAVTSPGTLICWLMLQRVVVEPAAMAALGVLVHRCPTCQLLDPTVVAGVVWMTLSMLAVVVAWGCGALVRTVLPAVCLHRAAAAALWAPTAATTAGVVCLAAVRVEASPRSPRTSPVVTAAAGGCVDWVSQVP
jgi:hypothetical protein